MNLADERLVVAFIAGSSTRIVLLVACSEVRLNVLNRLAVQKVMLLPLFKQQRHENTELLQLYSANNPSTNIQSFQRSTSQDQYLPRLGTLSRSQQCARTIHMIVTAISATRFSLGVHTGSAIEKRPASSLPVSAFITTIMDFVANTFEPRSDAVHAHFANMRAAARIVRAMVGIPVPSSEIRCVASSSLGPGAKMGTS